MKLPAMKYADGIGKGRQVKFGGYNHNLSAGDGEIYDMENLTSTYYPLLSPRPKRRLLTTLTTPNGIFGRDKLAYVDGTTFYYDGVSKGTVANSKKIFAAMGAYILIFPDKKYYNTRALGSFETLAALEAAVTSPGTNDCYAVGSAAPYDLYDWNGTGWNYLMAEFGSLEASWSGSLAFQDGTLYGAAATANTIYCAGVTWSDFFKAGDAVTISGCTVYTDNNKTPIIREIDGAYLRFYENVFDNGTESAVTIQRAVPDMHFICENENRLWGCRGDTIYASKLGDPFNWNGFDGLSTDSYCVDVGSAGEFTGSSSFLGYPIFFKPGHVYKVYGSIPSNYEVMGSATMGVAAGCGGSLAIAGEILFYLSRNGPAAYSGGIPSSIGAAFGTARYRNAVGGTDGLKYYISMQDGADNWHLFVYDTGRGLWHREDDTQVIGFAFVENLYYLASDGKIWIAGNIVNPPGGSSEESADVTWYAEFGDFVDDSPNKKGVSKLQFRLALDAGATVTVYIKFDSEAVWTTVQALTAAAKRSYCLPIIPRRGDHYRVKLAGTGGCRIYSMVREYYAGSER